MRIITPNNHPENVAVFFANSMEQAICAADRAMQREGIQAALWFSKPADLDLTQEVLLQQAFLRTSKQPPGAATTIDANRDPKSLQITVHVRKSDKQLSFGHRRKKERQLPRRFDASKHLDQTRMENIWALSRIFPQVQLGVRHELRGYFNPHFDSSKSNVSPPQAGLPFLGRRVRILNSRKGSGTLVYDLQGKIITKRFGKLPDDELARLPRAWQVAAGSYLFIGGEDWGPEKSILHTPEEFAFDDPAQRRVLDVYDCSRR